MLKLYLHLKREEGKRKGELMLSKLLLESSEYPVCVVNRREGYRRRNINNWRKNIQKQINNAQKQVNDAVAPWTSTRLPIIGDIVPVNKRDADEDEG